MRPPIIKTFIFTALPCEAKPLVAHFKLKKDHNSHPFAVYYNDNMALVVSGCGKTAMAAAVAYSLAWFKASPHPVLVNVGIAGHKTAALGDLFAAHKITDVDSGKHFYPQLVAKLPCSTQAMQTVSRPETNYADDCLYEMEASAFYEISSRFSSGEIIQAFKIISDNQESSIAKIDAASVSAAINAKITELAAGIKQLLLLAQSLETTEPPYYQFALEQWHFSVTAQLQLQTLLQRWNLLTNNAELDFTEVELKHGKEVLRWLEQKVDGLIFNL